MLYMVTVSIIELLISESPPYLWFNEEQGSRKELKNELACLGSFAPLCRAFRALLCMDKNWDGSVYC